MSNEAMLTIALIVAFAFSVEAALGFGATVVTVALGSLVLPLDAILPAFLPVNVALSAILVARGARSIAWRTLLVEIAPFVAAGLPIGIVLFTRVDERILKLGFGVFVIVLCAVELLAKKTGQPAQVKKPFAVGLLMLGGMIHGAFGTGGPMVVYVMGKTLGADKTRFRATLSVLWLTLNTILVTTYAVRGQLTASTARASAVFIASLAVGLVAGEAIFRRVSAARFRTFVFTMLAVAGAVLVVRNL